MIKIVLPSVIVGLLCCNVDFIPVPAHAAVKCNFNTVANLHYYYIHYYILKKCTHHKSTTLAGKKGIFLNCQNTLQKPLG